MQFKSDNNLTDASLPDRLYPVLWLGSIALIVHGIEGLIAAFQANACHKNFLTYGIYTFFVGFVGLLELQEILSNLKIIGTNKERSNNRL